MNTANQSQKSQTQKSQTQTSQTQTSATPYELIGGAAAVQRLVNAFYDEMETSPEATTLRAMHAVDLMPMRHTLFEFLSGWLGGPRTYFERSNARCLMSAHADLAIEPDAANQWLRCMRRALRQIDISGETLAFMDNAFTRVCNAMVNRPSRLGHHN